MKNLYDFNLCSISYCISYSKTCTLVQWNVACKTKLKHTNWSNTLWPQSQSKWSPKYSISLLQSWLLSNHHMRLVRVIYSAHFIYLLLYSSTQVLSLICKLNGHIFPKCILSFNSGSSVNETDILFSFSRWKIIQFIPFSPRSWYLLGATIKIIPYG